MTKVAKASTRPRRRAISSGTGATRREPRPTTVRRSSPAKPTYQHLAEGFVDRHALSFRAGHPSRGCQAGSPRPRRQGGRPLAHLRLCRSGRSGRAQAPASARCAIFSPTSPESPVRKYTPGGRGHRRGDRCPGGFPARSSRTRHRGHAVASSAPEGTLRASRLREDVLRRPEKRQRHL